MFSTDFFFRQQENLVDNQKFQAGFSNKILFLFFFLCRSQDQQPLFNCLTVWILVCFTFIPCPLLVQDCLNYIVWSQIWCRKWMKNFGQMFKIVWTAQISGKVNYVHSAMTKVNVNMTIGFIECWLKKFRENLECFKSSALTTAGGKYAKRRWDLLHAFPFYKKRSYKKRPIKFFNHKKPWPIEF